MADHGTSLIRFKRAFIDLLDAQTTEKVSYQSPQQAKDVLGESGSGIAAWFSDEATANHSVMVFKGAPHWIDEVANPVLRIQAVGPNTDSDQEDVDASASALLYKAIAVLAADPSVGLVDDTIQEFEALPAGLTYSGGLFGADQRGARFELAIEVSARLKLTL